MKDQTSPQAAGTNRGSSSGRTRLRTTAVQVGSECFSSISWRIMFVGLTISDRRWQRASAEAGDVVKPVTHKLNRMALQRSLDCQSSVLWFLEFSFVSQRDHRIDFCRPSRGYVTCQKRDANEQKRNRAKRNRIGWRYAKEKTRKEPGQPKRARDSCQDPDARKQHTSPEHNSEQVGWLCSQRNTQSELPCPLRYRVRNDPVDADCGEDKSHTGEKRQK